MKRTISNDQLANSDDAHVLSPGIVYVLSNPAMPDYVKVGRTQGDGPKDVLDRMGALDTTGIPRAFQCEYAAVVAEYEKIEQVLLTAFGENRVRPGREFLEGIPPFRVIAVIKHLALKDVTPDSGDIIDEPLEKPLRLPAFRFSMAGIQQGDFLQWADDSDKTCEVIEERRVRYEDQIYSLSRLTAKLKGWKVTYSQVGPYWVFKGRTLDELRTDYLSDSDGEEPARAG